MRTVRQFRTHFTGCSALIVRAACVAALTLALLNAAGCIEWSTNPQGQLRSIGVPGVPVWKSKTLNDQEQLSSRGALAASPGSMVDPKAADLVGQNTGAK
jgi:hypothetical protein